MAGKILLNGTDVTSRVYLVTASDSRTKYTLLGSKLTGWSTEVDAGTKKGLTAINTTLDGFAGHVYKNGVVAPIAMMGSRPVNKTRLFISTFQTLTITANSNGKLTIVDQDPQTYEVSLTETGVDTNVPYLNFDLVLWGGGGKGGSGAYFFLQGNWGGVGGSGGGKAIVNVTLRVGETVTLKLYEASSTSGEDTASDNQRYFAGCTVLYFDDTELLTAMGGASGLSNHPRSASMNNRIMVSETSVIFATDAMRSKQGQSFYDSSGNLRARFVTVNAIKGGYWVLNGNNGNASTFPSTNSGIFSNYVNDDLFQGNPEHLLGVIPQTGSGGTSVNNKYEQNRGSGGGGSYMQGGTAGDASGSSAGARGSFGGGGGGAGSPAGGAQGGSGGNHGCAIFY